MRAAFVRGLTAAARQDPRVMLLTSDLGFKIFDEFASEFPGRFLNVGVAESNMIGVAAGLALGGMRPFAYSIAPFATLRCLEHVRNDVCYHNVAVTIVGLGGGYSYGHNGPTHHSLEDIAVMRVLPNMTVVCPGDPVEVEQAVVAAAMNGSPVYLRIGRSGDPAVHSWACAFPDWARHHPARRPRLHADFHGQHAAARRRNLRPIAFEFDFLPRTQHAHGQAPG